MPGNAYFIENDEILAVPRDDGDCRYPYGFGGFNFWAYASGYMHCNEGIFSPFLRAGEGQEPKIAFFSAVPNRAGSLETVPLLSVPVMNNIVPVERFTVFTKSCVFYITEVNDFRFAVRAFVNRENEIFFTVTAENLSGRPGEIILSSFFNPFLMHDITESSENRWFREVRYCGAAGKDEPGPFLIKTNEDLSRTVSVSNYGIIRRTIRCEAGSRIISHEETASRYQYVGGSRGSLHMPKAVIQKKFDSARHVCAFTEVGAAGDIVRLNLSGNGSARYDIVFHYEMYCCEDAEIEKYLSSRVNPAEIDLCLSSLETLESEKNSILVCRAADSQEPRLKEELFHSLFEHLKKQVEFCSLIKGYVQMTAGSLIGIRDVFQALEGLTVWQPESARKKMLEALGFIGPDGRCPRQYSLPAGEGQVPAMDLRAFIDQGVWVISTIVTYLKYTGDFSFLEETCGYYEIVDEQRKLVKKSDVRDSVLKHMLRIMDYLTKNRDEETKCVLALYGDWNDALDGLGVSGDPAKEFGTGVSVMTSLQVCRNLKEMSELLKKLDEGKYDPYIARYQEIRKEIQDGLKKYAVVKGQNGEKRIVHGWGDKMSYFVGGFDDPDHKSRCGLTSNAFWVLSGLYDEDTDIKDSILDVFEKLDSKYGLRTFEPYFAPGTKGVGRIPKLPAGTAENGAVYVHATLFGVAALFRMGCPEAAWRQLIKVLPVTHSHLSCSPYVMPNSYGYNKELNIDGESMQDWQTGSSNMLFKLLIKYVFGICPEYDGLWIQPAGYGPFGSLELKIKIRSCDLFLICRWQKKGGRMFLVNGQRREPVFDEVMKLEKLWIPYEELNCGRMEIQISDTP
jgi:Cellobiose phosphorylase